MNWRKASVFTLIMTVALLVSLLPGLSLAQEQTNPEPAEPMAQQGPIVSGPVVPKISPAVRDLPQSLPSAEEPREINPLRNFFGPGSLEGTDTKILDPLAANGINSGHTPSPLLNFEGIGDLNQYTPPDTTGDVGPNHYVQMVNVKFAVYDKSGNLLHGPVDINSLWDGFGGPCENDNSGDPIVLYDDLADRWMITQFAVASGQEQCVAVSTTSDPLGTYYLYDFPMPAFPDYPKFGVWPDAYYFGTNTGYPHQYYAHALDRVNMLAGNPATLQSFGGNDNFLMPADVDGTLPPPAGSPGYFYTFYSNGYPDHPSGVDRLAIYEFNVDWNTPANSTFNLVTEIPIAPYNYTVCGFFVQNCVPQPGTSQRLDTLSYWPMVRWQYRNFGPYESAVGNFTVDLDGTDKAAIRWFELRKQGGNPWSLYQEGTYAPDNDHHWMGSIAQDGSGNIALGYSVSSNTTRPAIRYATRSKNDPLGTFQAEVSLIEGGGVQTGANRWGDYSSMTVDPTDQCTFWFTSEYHDVDDAGWGWNTRIGSFKVPGCTGSLGPTGTLAGVVTDSSTSSPIVGANIEAVLVLTPTISFNATSQTGGAYSMIVPATTYTVAGSAFGYLPTVITGVTVMSGTTTTQNIALDPAPSYVVSGTVTDAATGWPLYASIDIDGYPGDPIWNDPVSGFYSITLPGGIAYTFNVMAWVPGYETMTRTVGPLTGDTTEDFGLQADLTNCIAPGYSSSGGSCAPTAGGLVVGNVYDDNTGDPLVGADVENEDGYTATTEETPDDPDVDDGFYTLFSPQGSKTFTATMASYGPDVVTVTVVQSDTVGQDFFLPAGWLSGAPSTLQVTVDLGMSTTRAFTLTNNGGMAADYELIEWPGGFVPTVVAAKLSGDSLAIIQPERIELSLSNFPNVDGTPAAPWAPSGPVQLVLDDGSAENSIGLTGGGQLVWFNRFTPDPALFPFTLDQISLLFNNSVGVGDDMELIIWEDTDGDGDPGTGTNVLYYEWVTVQYNDLTTWNVYNLASPVTLSGPGDVLIGVVNRSGASGYSDFPAAIDQGTSQQRSWVGAYTAGDPPEPPTLPADRLWGTIDSFGLPGNWTLRGSGFTGGLDVPWLSEDPVSETVSALTSQAVTITFDASVPEVDQPGVYYARLKVDNNTPYTLTDVPVTMTVNAPLTWGKLEGTVTGLGYCDANPSALEGAEVLIEASGGMSWTLTTNASGYYQRWLDEAYSPLTVTVTYPEYETGLATGVMITGQVTTTQDFDLRWLKPCVDAIPSSFSAVLDMGMSTTLPLTLTNSGAVSTPFDLVEVDRGYTPFLVSIPTFEGKVEADTAPPSMARAPQPSGEVISEPASPLAFPLAGEPAYALDVYPGNNLVYIPDTTVPGTWNTIGSVTQFHPAGDFLNGDFSKLYALDYDSNEFVTIDTATAARTVIGTSTPRSGERWSGMTGATDGTLYASSAACGTRSTLYTINPADGAVTEIGEITGAACIIDIAINAQGEMYGVDIVSDQLYQIDPTTGAGTAIGALGVNANYAQGMDFEEKSGVLYWAAYTTQGELRIIDTATGASALVGAFPGGAEVDALAFPTGGGGDVPWLFEDPVTGTLVADTGLVTVDVTLDAAYVNQPGEYHATLNFKTEDPTNGSIDLPVTMTVNAPPTWGKLNGTVFDLGYCDVNTTTLQDALLVIQDGMQISLTTDVSGTYAIWLEAGAYTVTVSAADHVTTTTHISVTAQTTTTQDFYLRWTGPCAQAPVPDKMDVTVLLGNQETVPMVLENGGAAELSFQFHETTRTLTLKLDAAGPALAGQVHSVQEAKEATPEERGGGLWPLSSGGPDPYGYTYLDSNESGGPTFEWIEISGTGQDLNLGDDDYYWPIDLPFTFNYYGVDLTQIAVASNGTVYFEDDYLGLSNDCLPDTGYGIGNFLAGYWDDLNPLAGGAIYYEVVDYHGQDAAVIEWYQVPNYGTSDPVTYEIILLPNGSILMQYLDPSSEQGSGATVGIQGHDEDPTYYLEYSCDTAALTNNLAICFAYPGESGDCTAGGDIPWLSEDPITGTVPADGVRAVDVTFTAFPTLTTWASYPVFTGTLIVNTDDAMAGDNGKFYVPVTMTISAAPLCSFETNSPVTVGQTVIFTNTTLGDAPLSYRWNFGDGSTSTLISPTHVYSASNQYTVWLTATNSLGTDVCSATVEVNGPPQASFTSNSPIYLGNFAAFTNTTTAWPAVSIWFWNFGADATPATSASENPGPVVYSTVGERTVSLMAINSEGSDTYTDTVAVCSAPLTSLSFSYTEAKAGEVVTFTAAFSPVNVLPAPTIEWSFGATGITATHTFTPAGTYPVTVTATNPCDQMTYNETISVAQATPPVNYIYLPLVTKGQ